MDSTLRQLHRIAATGDKEAQDQFWKAAQRSGSRPWTERQYSIAKEVLDGKGDLVEILALFGTLENSKILGSNDLYYRKNKYLAYCVCGGGFMKINGSKGGREIDKVRMQERFIAWAEQVTGRKCL